MKLSFRFPSISQWGKLPRVLSQKEKIIASVLAFCFLASAIFLIRYAEVTYTKIVPSFGGSLKEGIVGSPRFINPIFSDANDADRDLVQLVFSGLFKYDSQGNIVPDLAKDYTVFDNGKTIEVDLKDRLAWSDGFPLTADDVVFTVHTLADPRYKSPVRANWVGVNVEKVSDLKLRFTLQQPYAPFIERLTQKIIPAHIWQNITPENFALSVYNIQPVGSGPFRIKSITREKSGAIKEIRMAQNLSYGGKEPFIQSLNFLFFENEAELINAAKSNLVQAFSPEIQKGATQKEQAGSRAYEFSLPRYFALFFNLASTTPNDPVEQKDIRQALLMALNRKELVQQLFGSEGKVVLSPFLPDIFGFSAPDEKTQASGTDILALFSKQGYTQNSDGKLAKTLPSSTGLQTDLGQGSKNSAEVKKLQSCLAQNPQVYPEGIVSGIFGSTTKSAVIRFQEKYAQDILAPSHLSSGNGVVGLSTRQKLNSICFSQTGGSVPFAITVSTTNQYPLADAANAIKNQWAKFGITTAINAQDPASLERDTIKPRNFQVLLFGELLGKIPDPFPFWYSSQKKDPGLNLSSYESKKLDTLLEQARKELDDAKRAALYQQMQTIVLGDIPVITLYDTPYLYVLPLEVKGANAGFIADPSQRFAGIADWYMYTKRVWK